MIALFVLASFLHLLHCHQAAVYNPSGGPVYVNPDSVQAAAAAAVQQNEAVELVTQTVYGFLDFTTTIGNTVMVFSPQSAGAPDAGKKTTPATTSVIQTKPGPATVQVPTSGQEIKPSKTMGKPSDQKKMTGGKVASNVEVKAGPSATVIHSVVEVRGGDKTAAPPPPPSSTKVEVKSGPSSVVEVLSSKVEVREGNTLKKEQPQPSTKVQVLEGPSSVVEVRNGPSKILSSHVEVVGGPVVPTAWSSVVEVRSSNDEPALSGNNIIEPEYDFLSRQPSEVVDETYRVINLRPSSKFHLKPRIGQSKVSSAPRGEPRPTGLVTKLGGTVVKEGVTTVHETSVIGTYISGKYAQVLQSTSHVFHHNSPKPKPTPTSSLRILKTAAPVLGGKPRSSAHLDPTPAGTLYEETLALPLEALFSSAPSSNLIRPSRRPGIASSPKNSLHNRFHRNRGRGEHQDNREQELGEGFDDEEDEDLILNSRKSVSSRPAVRPTQSSRPSYRTASKNGFGSNRFSRVTSTPELATVSVFSEVSSATPSGSRRYHSSQRRSGFRPSSTSSSTAESTSGYSRRGYKPRVQASSAENTSPTTSSSLYKFKLSRPTGRWQYKTTPRPRVTIRKSAEDDAQGDANGPTTPMNPPQANARSDDPEQDITGSESEVATFNEELNNEKESEISPQSTLAAETIKVEISTPVDFKDTYYEIATIKSPYTFQVGTLKNTRYITVTSTIEKSLEPEGPTIAPTATVTEPLTENILASTAAAYDKDNNLLLETSIATLPPIGLAGDAETPPLETLTETFSTTQLLLKTHILPVIRGGSNTTRYTLIQSYHVTRLVTATKTLPPMEVYHFVPSKTLNEFNTRLEEAGSELHLELDVGDQNDQDDDDQPAALRALQPDIDLANIGSDFDVSDVDKSRIPEGHLRLKKPSALATPRSEFQPQPQTPALSPEQIQQLAFLRLLNPAAAAAIPQVITTSRPVLKVETVYESHVLPVINGPNTIYSTISRPVATVSKTEYEYGTSTLPALPVAPVNPLFPPQQQQFAITSTPVVTQTVVTETNSKVLKLTFGAKTAYTTLLSTKVVPTVLTTYVTASIPVQPTAPAFPGFFPAPYPQFPFVG